MRWCFLWFNDFQLKIGNPRTEILYGSAERLNVFFPSTPETTCRNNNLHISRYDSTLNQLKNSHDVDVDGPYGAWRAAHHLFFFLPFGIAFNRVALHARSNIVKSVCRWSKIHSNTLRWWRRWGWTKIQQHNKNKKLEHNFRNAKWQSGSWNLFANWLFATGKCVQHFCNFTTQVFGK